MYMFKRLITKIRPTAVHESVISEEPGELVDRVEDAGKNILVFGSNWSYFVLFYSTWCR